VQNIIWRKAIGFFFKNIIKYRIFAKKENFFSVKYKKSVMGSKLAKIFSGMECNLRFRCL
jgi:hypothetical protein